ncbi:serine hydrolase domain-containing protein [Cellulophaga baltica]|uniref:serine hydrolase domain-containing protein n=1 Tax=Cellulophaga baltica TaxID=76594 RepID=UPI0024956F3E|nr:serine hydrolase domain-containing protein [Cellulophaga baltica]
MKLKLLHKIIIVFSFTASYSVSFSQSTKFQGISDAVDSLLQTNHPRPFNGQIILAVNDAIFYKKSIGFSKDKTEFTQTDKFIIGSLSKQITAVLILRAVEEEKLNLNDPISKYLPNLKMEWKNTITIHQLLNHTHGIIDLQEDLAFAPGTDFSYSNIGYQLLGEILEQRYNSTYVQLASNLFTLCGIANHLTSLTTKQPNLVEGKIKNKNNSYITSTTDFTTAYIPAGYLIASISDLLKWNTALHQQKLLQKESYQLLITPSATQNHSLFGPIGYAYGIRVSDENQLKEIGHTGYAPGYISMNLYYPEYKTSIIVLENLDWNDDAIIKTFYFEMKIREIFRQTLTKE